LETRLLGLLRNCNATRAIAERYVEPERVEVILEAARLSASCGNSEEGR
jgi:hypothetical protein